MDVETVRRIARRLLKSDLEGTAALKRELIRLLKECEGPSPQELIELFTRQLKADRRVRNQPRLKQHRILAIGLLAHRPNLSNRKLAQACGVSRPTIARWKKEPWFNRQVTQVAQVEGWREIMPLDMVRYLARHIGARIPR